MASLGLIRRDVLCFKIAPLLSIRDIVRLRQCNRHLLGSFPSVVSGDDTDIRLLDLFIQGNCHDVGWQRVHELQIFILIEDNVRFFELFLDIYHSFLVRMETLGDTPWSNKYDIYGCLMKLKSIKCLLFYWEKNGCEKLPDYAYSWFYDALYDNGGYLLAPFFRRYYSQDKLAKKILISPFAMVRLSFIDALLDKETVLRYPKVYPQNVEGKKAYELKIK
jgi:hypothetical protein